MAATGPAGLPKAPHPNAPSTRSTLSFASGAGVASAAGALAPRRPRRRRRFSSLAACSTERILSRTVSAHSPPGASQPPRGRRSARPQGIAAVMTVVTGASKWRGGGGLGVAEDEDEDEDEDDEVAEGGRSRYDPGSRATTRSLDTSAVPGGMGYQPEPEHESEHESEPGWAGWRVGSCRAASSRDGASCGRSRHRSSSCARPPDRYRPPGVDSFAKLRTRAPLPSSSAADSESQLHTQNSVAMVVAPAESPPLPFPPPPPPAAAAAAEQEIGGGGGGHDTPSAGAARGKAAL